MRRLHVLPAVCAALLALLLAPAVARADDDGWDLEPPRDEQPGRLTITGWGGEQFTTGSRGRSGPALGGEVAWAFDQVEVGAWASGYQHVRDAARDVTPVFLVRLTERFETRRGLEASLTLGAGAAKPDNWKAWFQVALGARLSLGPMFLAGEVGFEQYDIVRVSGGLGVRL